MWVARRIPDGYISAHANTFRITTFPLDDPNDTIYASDVITFARRKKLYNGTDAEFSFTDVYRPLDFDVVTTCEARVWHYFGQVMGKEWADKYEDFALGLNLSNRLPLWVKPEKPVNLTDMMEYMRSHYENTKLDMSGSMFADVGAGPWHSPYRQGALDWSGDKNDKTYYNQRVRIMCIFIHNTEAMYKLNIFIIAHRCIANRDEHGCDVEKLCTS